MKAKVSSDCENIDPALLKFDTLQMAAQPLDARPDIASKQIRFNDLHR